MKIEYKSATYLLSDQATWEEEKKGALKEIFRGGKLLIDQNLEEIRQRVKQ